MAAAGADGVAGDEHARPRHAAGVDGVAQADVDEVIAAEVAHEGEAGHQRAVRALGRLDCALGDLLLEVVELVGLPVARGFARQMRVRVHEAGQERRVAKVDDLRAGGRRGLGADGGDLVAVDDDDAGRDERVALAVVQMRRAQHDRFGRGGRGAEREGEEHSGEGEGEGHAHARTVHSPGATRTMPRFR